MTAHRVTSALILTGLLAVVAQSKAPEGDSAAQVAPVPTAPSKARLEVPVVSFNFGYVPQGASISHVFWLRNVGEDTLRITDVRPG